MFLWLRFDLNIIQMILFLRFYHINILIFIMRRNNRNRDQYKNSKDEPDSRDYME